MSKNRISRAPGRGRRTRGGAGTSGAFEVFRRPQRSIPALVLVVVWRWRWELIFLACTIAAFVALTNTGLPPIVAGLVLAGVAILMLSLPYVRQWTVTRIMCVLIRHRLRVCLSEMRTLNYSGYLPLIAHIRGTPVGLVAFIWMRPGLSVTDLENRTEHLAAACWAREVRIQRSRRLAALVRVDVVRRDPLDAPAPIASPLMANTSAIPMGQPGELPETALSGIIHPPGMTTSTVAGVPVDTVTATATTTGTATAGASASESGSATTATATKPRKTTKKTTTAATANAEPVVLVNGEDVSDYV